MENTPSSPQFAPLPGDETIRIAWPTPNRALLDDPARFFARTRVNPDFGKPGWTRDCGRRFHRGCDIAPVNATPANATARVTFTDCATGREFDSDEPVFVPHDPVYGVCDGAVVEIVNDESVSDFGKHIVLEHRWPVCGEKFYTVYGHLDELLIPRSALRVPRSALIGRMGRTARSADARNWLAIAPHLHFEVRDARHHPYDPVEFLRRLSV